MTDNEARFDRFFGTLRSSDPLHGAHILRLDGAATEDSSNLLQAFRLIRNEINDRFSTNAVDIVSPSGKVRLHMDYIASLEVNALAFQFEDWYFIGITEGMLLLFARTCNDLWRSNSVAELLGVNITEESEQVILQSLLLIELQYISYHELGHIFHGHCADLSLSYYRAELDAQMLLGESIGMEGQAMELEADGYAVNLMLKNLLRSESAAIIRKRLGSTLPGRQVALTLFMISIAAVIYYLEPPTRFDPVYIRHSKHSKGMIRLAILLDEVLGWCRHNLNWREAISQMHFQRILTVIAVAASNPTQEVIWAEQRAFLETQEGETYIADIYKRRMSLRNKMESHCWRMNSETSAD